jgi:preprotein translocase subunit SecA
MVTIATNMAGRGTDIVLGGKKEDQSEEEWRDNNDKVLSSGGLHILGTERHESRRIDNQLRGRSGRQGDPGYSRFFLSLEDDLLRLFISDSRRALFDKIGMGDDHIEHRMLSRGIENAQKRIESKNFDARKSLLEYDDVSNDQRQAIYSLRNQLLEEEDISETINNLIEDQFNIITNSFIPVESVESQWKTKDLENHLLDTYSLETNIAQKISEDKKLIPETIVSLIISMAKDKYAEKYKDIGDRRLMLEKQVMLQVLDVHWKEHLGEIDHLRNSIGLRAYAQKNPKNEFKKEAYSMFESMLDEIDGGTVRILFSLQIANEDDIKSIKQNEQKQEMTLEKAESKSYNNDNLDSQSKISKVNTETIKRDEPKLGRNDLVKITNGKIIQELKYKKAKPMIESGEWRLS